MDKVVPAPGLARRSTQFFGFAALAVLLALASRTSAQDPNAPGPGDEAPPPGDSSLTNLVDLLSDTAPDNEPAMEDASAGSGTNGFSPGNPASGNSYRRPSGRESRSQRFGRSRSGRSNGYSRDGYSGVGFGGTNAGPNSLEWAAFQSIVDGNIFNPNRTPRGGGYQPPVPVRPDREYFTLVGTMSYQDGTFAFFDGRSSEFQKALKRSDIIAGYKLAAIDQDSVKLTRFTNQVDLRLGMQMRRDDDGSWYTSSGPASYTASSLGTGTTSTPVSTDSGTAAVPSGPESDILKKLMERREKE